MATKARSAVPPVNGSDALKTGTPKAVIKKLLIVNYKGSEGIHLTILSPRYLSVCDLVKVAIIVCF